MPKINYKDCNFRSATLALIEQCNSIIAEYTADGLKLTLRQLYYQLVSRDVIANTIKEYNKLGCTVNDARLAGLIDWNSIEDRTRNLATIGHWESPQGILEACASNFRVDKWEDQDVRPEVWIEKEALAGVFERVCSQLDVPYLSCRGYTSQSEMWGAAMRFARYIKDGKRVHIFHFGDHDPSGIDMTRDIEDRIRMFLHHHVGNKQSVVFQLTRIALNMNQVEQYNPPENPAKSTDTRFRSYMDNYGESSWELDALNPRILAALVRDNILEIRNEERWTAQLEREAKDRALLSVSATYWDSELSEHIEETYEDEYKQEISSQRAALIGDGEADEEIEE